MELKEVWMVDYARTAKKNRTARAARMAPSLHQAAAPRDYFRMLRRLGYYLIRMLPNPKTPAPTLIRLSSREKFLVGWGHTPPIKIG